MLPRRKQAGRYEPGGGGAIVGRSSGAPPCLVYGGSLWAYRGDVDDFSGRLISGRNELEALELDDALPLDRYTDGYFSEK